MRNLLLFLRHCLKSPTVLLSMGIVGLVASLSFGYTALKEDRPCVIFDADSTAPSQAVLDYLETREFQLCDSREALLEELQTGNADCGIVLKEGFAEALEAGNLRNCAELLVTSRTSRDNTFSMIALVGIYRQYAPYLAAEIAENQGLPSDPQAIISGYETYEGTVPKLEFQVTSVAGQVLEEAPSTNLPMALIAISIMVAFGFLSMGGLRRSTAALRPRFSVRRLLLLEILPQSAALALCLWLGAALGAVLGSFRFYVPLSTLLPALLGYTLALGWFFSFLLAAGLSAHALSSLIALDAAISLFLCPAYWDIALYAPVLTPVRVLSIPYWLYLFSAYPAASIVPAVLTVLILWLTARKRS